MNQEIVGKVLFEVRSEIGNPVEVCDRLVRSFMDVVEERKTRNPSGWRDSVEASQDSIMVQIAAKHGLIVEISGDNHYVFVDGPNDPWAGWN